MEGPLNPRHEECGGRFVPVVNRTENLEEGADVMVCVECGKGRSYPGS